MNAETLSLKNRVSEAEWHTRVQLAALYRLSALYGWDDFLYTHISARVPGPDPHFLLNPYGLWFEEVTASSLVKVDLDGQVIDGHWGINQAGYVIHSALHAAREDAHFIAHFHTDDGMAASSQRCGLLPLNQRALTAIPDLAYHDYEGIALHLDERERVVEDLGPRHQMLLRNHGTLAIGRSAAQVWSRIYQLEKACSAQVRALAAGEDAVLLAPEAAQATVARQVAGRGDAPGPSARAHDDLLWQAIWRKVQRHSPGCDT
jgi:ribulose-5-phosphate 4-epimerase/fuculose-1-phosphate aldolase